MPEPEELIPETPGFGPQLVPGPEGLGRFRPLPTITTPDGVVHVDQELLRAMTPEQQEVYNAFIEAYRVDPRAIGAAPAPSEAPPVNAPLPGFPAPGLAPPEPPPAPQFLPGPIVQPAPPGGVSGKPGADQNLYALFGRLTEDGQAIVQPDGTTVTQLPPNWAYDPATREIYHIPAPALDRATFLPLAQRAGGGIELAIPQAIYGAIEAIDRAVERQRRGLIVPQSTLNREAIEVAGMASSGSFGMAQAGTVARQMIGEVAPAPGTVRRLVGAPPGTRGQDPVTPLAPGFQLGTAGLGSPPKPPKPPVLETPRPQLDPAGFYSQAERAALEILPPRAPGVDMLGIMTSPRGRVVEAEIRDMNLDSFLLGDEFATARRAVMQHELNASDYQRRIQEFRRELTTPGAVPAQIRSRIAIFEDLELISRQALAQEQAKLAQIRATHPSRQVTRDAIAEYAREHRVRLADTVYKSPEYDADVTDAVYAVRDLFARDVGLPRRLAERASIRAGDAIDAVLAMTRALEDVTPAGLRSGLDEIAIYHPELVPHVKREISRTAGQSADRLLAAARKSDKVTTFSSSTIDPRNPTNKEIVLRINSPDNNEAMRILDSIPRHHARIIAWMEGQSREDMIRIGLSRDDIAAVLASRRQYPREVAQLRSLAERGVWLGGHFNDPSWTGMAMTSIQSLADGRRALFLNQLQSDWTNAIEAGRTSIKNVMVSSLSRWVDPMLRRVLREAVESDADVIIVPNGATVNRYNALGDGDAAEGLMRLYNQAYPRGMASVMREIDSTVPKGGTPIRGADIRTTPAEGLAMRPRSIPEMYSREILGQMFEITPAIRAHFRQGRGMRLLSGAAAPVSQGEQRDGASANQPASSRR